MLGFPSAKRSSFPTGECAITLQSGAMPGFGTWFLSTISYFWLIKCIVALPIHPSYSTFGTHQHAMSSNIFLVSWNVASKFWYAHLKLAWIFKYIYHQLLQQSTISFAISIPLISVISPRLRIYNPAGARVNWQMRFHTVHCAERDRANNRCDNISNAMWVQYQQYLTAGGDDNND